MGDGKGKRRYHRPDSVDQVCMLHRVHADSRRFHFNLLTSHLHSTAVGKRRYCCVVRIGWSFLPPPCCLCPCHDQRHHISESHVFLPDRLVLSSVAFSGMVAGMYWYQYELTGDVTWAVRAEVFLRRRRCLLYTWAVVHEAAQDAVDSWPPLGATFPRICRMHHQASLAEL